MPSGAVSGTMYDSTRRMSTMSPLVAVRWCSGRHHDPPEGEAGLDVAVGISGIGERVDAVDDGAQLAPAETVDGPRDDVVGALRLLRLLHGEEDRGHRAVLLHQRPEVRRWSAAAGVAHPADPAAVGGTGDAAFEGAPADGVDDEVGATAVGDAHDLGRHVLGRVVDPMVEPEPGEAF